MYVPANPITTESAPFGTRPRLQLDAVLQRPPPELLHVSVAPAVMSNAVLVALVSPDAFATSV